MAHKNAHSYWVEEAGLGVVLASLIMLIAAPAVVYATDSATGDFSGTLNQMSQSITDLKNQIATLGSKFDNFSSKLDSLNSRVETLALANKDSNVTAPGMAECLSGCRNTAATCLSARAANPRAGISPIAAPTNSDSIKSACLSQSGTCIQSCRPQSTAVSCDTSCAVQLGACVRGAGSDITAIRSCRATNEKCLTTACAPQRVAIGSQQVSVTLVLPPGTCQSQCNLEYSICSQGARFDQTSLDECGKARQTCSQVACQGPAQAPAAAVTPSTNNAQTPRNIACENTCTDSYYRCKQSAGDDQDAIGTCGNTYGTCRNQCLIQSGGGFGTGGATAPGM